MAGRSTSLATSAAALLLAAAGTAHAGWRLDLAAQVADMVYPAPCPVTVRFAPLPIGGHVDTLAQADTAACTITFNSLRTWRSFPRLCSVFLHERGHLAGLGHSADPWDVMFPTLVRFDERCLIRWPWRETETQ